MAINYKAEVERYKRYYKNIGEASGQPKTQAYTTAIFSFLAVSLFGWYAIRPTIVTILFLQREIADNKVVSQQMETKIGNLIEAQATLQQHQNDLPLLSQALPQDPAALRLANALKQLGNSSGASVSAINIAKVPLIGGVATPSARISTNPLSALQSYKIIDIPITLSVSGTYSKLENFLNGVINLRRIISINSIDITPQGGQPGTSEIELSAALRLTAHYLQ